MRRGTKNKRERGRECAPDEDIAEIVELHGLQGVSKHDVVRALLHSS